MVLNKDGRQFIIGTSGTLQACTFLDIGIISVYEDELIRCSLQI
jgi:hypothetical protein